MQWHDPLYGPWELPDAVARLVLTDRAVRMQDISQSVLPLMFEPYGHMPSRFEHGLGVARLAVEVLKWQSRHLDEKYQVLLPVAAFLHDCGNPPFSHLAEPFLRKDFNKDGESFLTAMLKGSQTEEELGHLGLTVKEVTDMVTGKDKPVAEVLAGSLDIDNLDNVARYWVPGSGGKSASYSPLGMASAYRFDPVENRWTLLASSYDQAQAWKKDRQGIYELIYSHPHWGAAAMVQRALYLHWKDTGGLPRSFYFLTDKEAALHLMSSRVDQARDLMVRAANHDWFVPVVHEKFEGPVSERLANFGKGDLLARHTLADAIATEFGVPAHYVCTAVGKGRDRRKIELPFSNPDGSVVRSDQGPSVPPTRVFVWVHTDLTHLQDGIVDYIQAHVI